MIHENIVSNLVSCYTTGSKLWYMTGSELCYINSSEYYIRLVANYDIFHT
jgi:hypothetical protein